MSTSIDIKALLQQELAELRSSRRSELRQQFSDETLYWLALLPEWTSDLYERARLSDDLNISDLIKRGEEHGLFRVATTTQGLGDAPQQHFWIPADLRCELLSEIRGVPSQRIFELAAQLDKDPSPDISHQTKAWARLVQADPWRSAPRRFETFVIQQVQQDVDQWGASAGNIWVSALSDIAIMAPDQLNGMLRRLRWRLALVDRIERDGALLHGYISRDEHMSTIEKLLAVQGTLWCLHLLGQGGVGKTMLMRYLTVHGARQFGYQVVRIDFDYLSPDYPWRDPGALFSAIVSELLIHSSSGRFDDTVGNLNGYLDTLKVRLARDGASLQGEQIYALPEFQDVRREFKALLLQLGKALFIFDTCEELAKLHPLESTSLPSLEMTFKIIEDLHSEIPELRIVFAGRRPLARSGGQDLGPGMAWKIPNASLRLPPQKEYLALEVIQGFNQDEAENLFDEIERRRNASADRESGNTGARARLDLHIRERILSYSAEVSQPIVIEPPSTNDEPRYNPFDLNLLANWVLDDPQEAVKAIESRERDVYVRRRIVDRLEPAVRALVPLAVILRRFSREMLAATDLVSADVESAFRILSEQEWTSLTGSPGTEVLAVDRHLLPRLDRYYEADQVIDLPDSQYSMTMKELGQHIATGLVKLAEKSDIAEIDKDFVDVILRRHTPLAASQFWDDFCLRIAAAGHWSRLVEISGYLLGDEGAIGRQEDHPLRAGVLAAMCSLIHTDASATETAGLWQSVLSSYQEYPNKATGLRLMYRARLAKPGVDLIAVFDEILSSLSPASSVTVSSNLPLLEHPFSADLQLSASFLAAVSRELDACEQAGIPFDRPEALLSRLRAGRFLTDRPARDETKTAVEIPLLFCRAQEVRLEREPSLYSDVELPLLGSRSLDNRQCWFDLVLPDDSYARAALESVRRFGSVQLGRIVSTLDTWQDLPKRYDVEPTIAQPNIDRERLLSAVLQCVLEYQCVPLADLRSLRLLYRDQKITKSKCVAHEKIPPIQAAVAEALADAGAPLEAVSFLDDLLSRSRKEFDDGTRLAISRSRLHIARRHRLHRELAGSDQFLTDSELRMDALAAKFLNFPIAAVARPFPVGQLPGRDNEISTQYATEVQQKLRPDRLRPSQAGPRMLAQVRLDSAELMMESKSISDEARAVAAEFGNLDDVLGSLRATILAFIYRDGDAQELTVLREKYNAVHRLLATKHPDGALPTWALLELETDQYAKAPNSSNLGGGSYNQDGVANLIQNPVLGGWLLRILAILFASRRSKPASTRFDALLDKEFPSGLPEELSRLVRRDRKLRQQTPYSDLLTGFVGLAVVAGIFYAGYLGLKQSAQLIPIAAKNELIVGWIILGFGILSISILIGLVWSSIRSRNRIRIRVHGQYESSATEKAQLTTMEFRLLTQTFRFAVRYVQRKLTIGIHRDVHEGTVWKVPSESKLPPTTLEGWNEGKLQLKSTLQRHEPFTGHPVELEFPQAIIGPLQGFPEWSWERTIRSTLQPESHTQQASELGIVRIGPPLSSPQGLSKSTKLFLLEGGRITAYLQNTEITSLGYKEFLDQQEVAREGPVIICGKAFQDSEGTFLQLGESSIDISSSTTGTSGETLQPRQCVRAGSPLLILMGVGVEIQERFETDRRQAEHLRRAGAEVFQAGAESVVVIPSMPTVAIVRVISEMARSLPSRNIVRLVRVVRDLILYGKDDLGMSRQSIHKGWADYLGISSESLTEIADEVCVYTRIPDWSKSRGEGIPPEVTGLTITW